MARDRLVSPLSSWPYVITLDWDSGSDGYRAQRITDVIQSKPKVRVSRLDFVSLAY